MDADRSGSIYFPCRAADDSRLERSNLSAISCTNGAPFVGFPPYFAKQTSGCAPQSTARSVHVTAKSPPSDMDPIAVSMNGAADPYGSKSITLNIPLELCIKELNIKIGIDLYL